MILYNNIDFDVLALHLDLGCLSYFLKLVLPLTHPSLCLHRTIVYLSIVYAIGQVVMAVGAIHDITDLDKDGTPDNMAFHM